MPWYVNLVIVLWFLMMAYISGPSSSKRLTFTWMAAGWAIGYIIFLML